MRHSRETIPVHIEFRLPRERSTVDLHRLAHVVIRDLKAPGRHFLESTLIGVIRHTTTTYGLVRFDMYGR